MSAPMGNANGSREPGPHDPGPGVRPSSIAGKGLALAAAVIVVDQASKWWILTSVMRPPRVIEVTPFFNLVMGWNRGVSFGLFNSDSPLNLWLLPLMVVGITAVLLVWLWRAERLWLGIGIGLVVGGAVGNLVDRMRFGAVADFLDVHAFGWHWPAFNVADSAITVGAAIILLESLFTREKKP
jgi:signal peptidase II